jgi:hypothetical protein
VSCAGLGPTLSLAQRARLADLVSSTLTLKTADGATAYLKGGGARAWQGTRGRRPGLGNRPTPVNGCPQRIPLRDDEDAVCAGSERPPGVPVAGSTTGQPGPIAPYGILMTVS